MCKLPLDYGLESVLLLQTYSALVASGHAQLSESQITDSRLSGILYRCEPFEMNKNCAIFVNANSEKR